MGGERGVLVSGNWKMHEDHVEALEFVHDLAALLRVSGVPAGREVSIHPPFTSLPALQAAVEAGHMPWRSGLRRVISPTPGRTPGR
jgi:triosephosphate isomerase